MVIVKHKNNYYYLSCTFRVKGKVVNRGRYLGAHRNYSGDKNLKRKSFK